MRRLLVLVILLCVAAPAYAQVCSHSGTVWTCNDLGNTINNGTALQSAINSAACGERIRVASGVTFARGATTPVAASNPLTFPDKSCKFTEPVVIESSAILSLPQGQRVSRSNTNMATIVTNNNGPVMDFSNATAYVVQGVEITNSASLVTNSGFVPALVTMGGSASNITLDRVWIHPSEAVTAPTLQWRSAGIGVDQWSGSYLTISNSAINGFTGYQANSHSTEIYSNAIAMVSKGAGPHKVINNDLEAYRLTFTTGQNALPCSGGCATISSSPDLTHATLSNVTGLVVGDLIALQTSSGWRGATVTAIAGNNITFTSPASLGASSTGGVGCNGVGSGLTIGGAAQWRGLRVNNLTIQRNTFSSPALWTGWGLQVDHRNLLIYSGVNVDINGNNFIDQMTGGYSPIGIFQNLTGGDIWSQLVNLRFRNNIINDRLDMLLATSQTGGPCAWSSYDIFITNNLWRQASTTWAAEWYGPWGNIAPGVAAPNPALTFSHNLMRNNWSSVFPTGGGMNVSLKDNITNTGLYGINDTGSNYPGFSGLKNIFIDNSGGGSFPSLVSGSYLVANDAAVGFTNVSSADSGGDYHGYVLTGASAYKGQASDGTDPGPNYTTLDAAQAGSCTHVGTTWTCDNTGDVYRNGDIFTSALASATCGETIVLTAGATYSTKTYGFNSAGPYGSTFTLSANCTAGSPITIRTSGGLPSGRIDPAIHLPLVATLIGETNDPIITIGNGAGGYTLRGIQVTQSSQVNIMQGYTLNMIIHDTGFNPNFHDMTYDQVIVRPYEETTANPDGYNVRSAQRGIFVGGPRTTVTRSWIGGFCCRDTHTNSFTNNIAIWADIGLGPITITNNYIEAYWNNIMTGGGGTLVPLTTGTISASTTTTAILSSTTNLAVGDVIRMPVTTYTNGAGYATSYGAAFVDTKVGNNITFHYFGIDNPGTAPTVGGSAAWKTDRTQMELDGMTVKGNTLNKRAAWASNSGQCKYFWEMKKGSHILFQGNTVTGPIDSISSVKCPMLAYAINQYGDDPWSQNVSVTFRDNLFYGVSQFQIACPYHSNLGVKDVLVTNNVFGGTTGRYTGPSYVFDVGCPGEFSANWSFTHNTIRGMTGGYFKDNGASINIANVIVKDNIMSSGLYWTSGNIVTCCAPYTETKNVIVNDSGAGAPSNTSTDYVVGSDAAVGFTNVANGDSGADYHGYALTGGTSCTSGNYRNCASDGTNPGVDFVALDAALATASSAGPSNLGSGVGLGRGVIVQ